VEAWLELVTADPADREAREGLDRGLAQLGERKEWERMVGIMISRAEVIPEPASQAAALREVALLLEHEMVDTDRGYSVMMAPCDCGRRRGSAGRCQALGRKGGPVG